MEFDLPAAPAYSNSTPQSYIALSFTRDDMRNTQVLSPDGHALYTVFTDKISNSKTTVSRGGPESRSSVVAEVHYRDILADTIKFENESSMKLNKWLHGVHGKWTDYPTSFECGTQKYTWKTNAARQIALYGEQDPDKAVAWFETSKHNKAADGTRQTTPARLALEPDGQPIMDAIVLSLLLVEQQLRMKDKFVDIGGGMGQEEQGFQRKAWNM